MNDQNMSLLRSITYPPLGDRPVEILQSMLYQDPETMQMVLTLRMKNVSGNTLSSVYVNLCCFDEEVNLVSTKTQEPYENLSVLDGEEFGADIPIALSSLRTRSITATVSRVCFSDGGLWNSNQAEKQCQVADKAPDLIEVFGSQSLPTEKPKRRWPKIAAILLLLLFASAVGSGIALYQVHQEQVLAESATLFQKGEYQEAKEHWGSLTKFWLPQSLREDIVWYQALCDIKSEQYLSAMQTLASQPNHEKSVATLRQLNSLLSGIVSAGRDHSAAVRVNGTVHTAGDNTFGQCNTADWTGIVSVSAGWFHTLGLRIDGTVLAAGDMEHPACQVTELSNVVDISAGQNHSVAVLATGNVVALGDNSYGQCDTEKWSGIIAVAAGRNHTVGLCQDGTVVAVGDNPNGCCNVEKWEDIIAIAAGDGFTLGIKKDGSVLAIGNPGCYEDLPQTQGAINGAVGAYHTILTKPDGTFCSKGNDDKHQTEVAHWQDVYVTAGGVWHSVGIKPDGTAYAIGGNESGQCNVGNWDRLGLPKSALRLTGIESDCTMIK